MVFYITQWRYGLVILVGVIGMSALHGAQDFEAALESLNVLSDQKLEIIAQWNAQSGPNKKELLAMVTRFNKERNKGAVLREFVAHQMMLLHRVEALEAVFHKAAEKGSGSSGSGKKKKVVERIDVSPEIQQSILNWINNRDKHPNDLILQQLKGHEDEVIQELASHGTRREAVQENFDNILKGAGQSMAHQIEGWIQQFTESWGQGILTDILQTTFARLIEAKKAEEAQSAAAAQLAKQGIDAANREQREQQAKKDLEKGKLREKGLERYFYFHYVLIPELALIKNDILIPLAKLNDFRIFDVTNEIGDAYKKKDWKAAQALLQKYKAEIQKIPAVYQQLEVALAAAQQYPNGGEFINEGTIGKDLYVWFAKSQIPAVDTTLRGLEKTQRKEMMNVLREIDKQMQKIGFNDPHRRVLNLKELSDALERALRLGQQFGLKETWEYTPYEKSNPLMFVLRQLINEIYTRRKEERIEA